MRVGLAALLLIQALALPGALADDAARPHYAVVGASPDGIGKTYLGREIAKVMSYHGAPWLERPERMQEERPDLVLAALNLKLGMAVADVGAGTGYYSWRMARARGSTRHRLRGRRPARNDRDSAAADGAARRQQRESDTRHPHRSTPPRGRTRPRADGGRLPRVRISVRDARGDRARAETGGRVVFVEYRGNDPAVPIKPLHTMTEAQVRKEAAVHSLEWLKTEGNLPWQHVIVFRKK